MKTKTKSDRRAISKKDVSLLARRFGAMCSVVLHRKVEVHPISGDDLGYTVAADKGIWLNFNHYIVGRLLLTMKQRITFALGVCVHELLHLLLTSFDAMSSFAETKPAYAQDIAHTFLNITEDARIEYHAPLVVGNVMCDALAFNKANTFKAAPCLEEDKDGFGQYVNALIQYGDAEKIKGKFTDKLAADIFEKSIPLLDASTRCSSTKKCAEYTGEIYEMSKPLWEERAKEGEEFSKMLQALLKKLAKEGFDVSHTPSGGGSGGGPMVELPVDSGETIKPSADKSKKAASGAAGDKLGEDILEAAEAESVDSSGDGKTKPSEITVSAPSCSSYMYREISQQVAIERKILCRNLAKLFQNDTGKEVYSRMGKYQPLREFGTRETQRVCTKKIDPDEKHSLAIMVLVDESGSMRCNNRIDVARKIAVLLADMANELDIPISVIGFDADRYVQGEYREVIHTKYILWDNSETKRSALAKISDKDNNADAYSIRYASKLLERRSERHKLLLVVSDGVPASHVSSGQEGIRDVKRAIESSKKAGQIVCGILVGNEDPKTHQEMYGRNFVHTNDENISRALAQKLTSLIKEAH